MYSQFSINHIAITSSHPIELAFFYAETLGLEKIQTNYYDHGGIRSIWFALNSETILMLEKQDLDKNQGNGFHMLAFTVTVEGKQEWKKKLMSQGISIISESEYSFYFNDTDGNRLSFSSFHLAEFLGKENV